MTNKRILIIGGSGFVGAKLVDQLKANDDIVAFTYANRKLTFGVPAYRVDLTDGWESLQSCIVDFAPDIVVHCAIPVGDDSALHYRVNVESVNHITPYLDLSALLIYFSTNAVFNDGGPHTEESLPRLRQDRYRVYGMTRANGEQVALQQWANTLVIRTDTVNGFDVQGNLNRRLATVVDMLREGQTIKRFQDRFVTPTLVDNLVEATIETCRDDFTYRGILHLAGSQRLTDYDYTRLLAQQLKIDDLLVEPQLVSNSALDIPRDNTLDISKAQSLLRTPLLSVKSQLTRLFP